MGVFEGGTPHFLCCRRRFSRAEDGQPHLKDEKWKENKYGKKEEVPETAGSMGSPREGADAGWEGGGDHLAHFSALLGVGQCGAVMISKLAETSV